MHERDYLNASTAYRTIYDECVKSDLESADYRARAFQNFVVFLLVSPYTQEKVAQLTKLESAYARELEKELLLARLVRKLLTFEPIQIGTKLSLIDTLRRVFITSGGKDALSLKMEDPFAIAFFNLNPCGI